MAIGRVALLALCGAALPTAALHSRQVPPSLKIAPFSKIADEIMEAEKAAEELQWRVGNSSQEKASLQWFMATAMKELTNFQKVVLNASIEGTLGNKYEKCVNRTSVKYPTYNQSLTLGQAVQKDDDLAPTMVEARMYELYQLEQQQKDLTMQLGECSARCTSLLARGRITLAANGAQKPGPRELMKNVAHAIYNTSASIDQMNLRLRKDESAKAVLENLSSLVMGKLLDVKKAVEEMKQDLERCLHTPQATRLVDAVTDEMAQNTEMTLDLVKTAEGQTKDAQAEVASLQAKLDACKRRC